MSEQIEAGPPPDLPDYALPAWASCLDWASRHQPTLAAFRAEKGYPQPKTELDVLIDRATGRDQSIGPDFVRWFNENVWGGWQDKP